MSKEFQIPDLSNLVFDASQHEGIQNPEGDFWVFAYGSLMWNPEFRYLRSETAYLQGFHRCLCLWSVEYRGTLENPGLVMGLDNGGSCVGRAFLISKQDAPNVVVQLNEREMITGAYRPEVQPLQLVSGEQVEGVCLISRREHPQYAPHLPYHTIVELIKRARGQRGSNIEYVLNTVHHLREMGMVDEALDEIGRQLEQPHEASIP